MGILADLKNYNVASVDGRIVVHVPYALINRKSRYRTFLA